jgi:hypothetical protein
MSDIKCAVVSERVKTKICARYRITMVSILIVQRQRQDICNM